MNPETRAVRSARSSQDAILARNWTAFADCLSDAFRYDDRRSGLQSSGGKTENINQLRVVAELGLNRIDYDVIETRGELFVLAEISFHIGDFFASMLSVTQIDEDGRLLVGILFDESDRDAAYAELDALDSRSD